MNNIINGQELFDLIMTEYFNETVGVIQLQYSDFTQDVIERDLKQMLLILFLKYSNWTLRYPFDNEAVTPTKNNYTIKECQRIFRDIFPSFYWLNKKNILANLDSFADMNNWGQKEKANIKQLIVENYIPLNNNIESPHTSTPTTTTQDSQFVDFIKYYQSLSIVNNKLFDSIYTEFMPLFKLIYV